MYLREFLVYLLLFILCILFIFCGLQYKRLYLENKQLKVFAVYNECAVFTSTDFSGIKFNHEKPQVLSDTR